MLHTFTRLGSVVLTLSLGVACSSSKDATGSDGGSGGSNVGTGGESGSGGSGGEHTGSGGSSGQAGTGGSADGGSSGHDAGSSTGGSGTADSGSTGGSNTTDSGSTGGSGATDSGTVAQNVLVNPGFEDGTMSPWTSNSSNFIVDGDSPRTGAYDGKLYSGFGDPTWDETMSGEALLIPAGTYTFHVWAKKSGTGTLTTLRLEASSSGSTKTLDILANVTAAYQEFSVSDITVASPNGPNLGACTVRVAAAGDDQVSVYLDDASLTMNP
ncbi:MAG TPA: carbohydrate binding domain-containing protein [Polyangiaceae bacterium]|nr:carbohydrate binding domain-containing protein [Polyangiaceae bacterium]